MNKPEYSGNLAQRSQVTIPKAIGEKLGLEPLSKVTSPLKDSGTIELQATPNILNIAGKYTKKSNRKDLSKLRDDMEKVPYTRP